MPVYIRTDYPRQPKRVDTWIPLPDGAQLSARVWLPDDAEDDPVPAIMVYEPYRDNDWWDARRWLGYFAGHGYAGIYVDRRGSSGSDGIFDDEYSEEELSDGAAAIAWLAEQSWCTGAVGMMGSSWSGFNTLQIAARRPAALKAGITMYSTDDRYGNDIHFTGGCALAMHMLTWASRMLVANARPPDPELVGERWRDMWLERMEKTQPAVETWLAHQRHDQYWRPGSVQEGYDAIECPMFILGGWGDPYIPSALRLLEHLTCAKRAIIGPWGHRIPEEGLPGPAIGWLQECLRWWDYWLKGIDTGVMDEPLLRYYRQEAVSPGPRTLWPGRWSSELEWPSPEVATHRYHLATDRLAEDAEPEVALDWIGHPAAGLDAGDWWGYGDQTNMPPDQRAEDGLSLTFTSSPLGDELEILGSSTLDLDFAVDRPRALLAVRLCDVAPDGRSTLITRGLLNLCHHESREHPTPLEEGRRYSARVSLNPVSYVLPEGHRLRLSLSQNDWPYAWPSPEPVTLRVFGGETARLEIPVRMPTATETEEPRFAEPEIFPEPKRDSVAADRVKTRSIDRLTGKIEILSSSSSRTRDPDARREWASSTLDLASMIQGDPLSTLMRCERMVAVDQDDWQIRLESVSTMSCDAETFRVANVLHAYEGSACVFVKTWSVAVPRDCL